MSNQIVFVSGSKGGSTKTTTAALLCLGSILRFEPVAFVLTDPRRKIRKDGRPFDVLDGKEPKDLMKIIDVHKNIGDGWLIIDGGGNRPDVDRVIHEEIADLTLCPFKASTEDTDTVLDDLAAMPTAYAWASAWSQNVFARTEAQRHIEAVKKIYPNRLIERPIDFVNSAASLLDEVFNMPSTALRSEAKKAFDTMKDTYERHTKSKGNRAA